MSKTTIIEEYDENGKLTKKTTITGDDTTPNLIPYYPYPVYPNPYEPNKYHEYPITWYKSSNGTVN